MIPTVALVGRPNTGKSTLFNRLLGRKSSITYDEAGTTRDRVFGHIYIDEKPIMLVDTGGLEFAEPTSDIESNIQKQTMIAIEEADVIVFLIDVTQELTANDFNAAQILRESKKEVILVASKCDSVNIETHFYNIYELGFGDPIKLSSIHGTGLPDLKKMMASVTKDYDYQDKIKFDNRINLTFVGKPNAGKSSLVNSLLGKEQVIVTDTPGTTLDAVSLLFDYEDQGYVFVDTAGIRKSGKRRDDWLEKFSFIKSLRSIESCDVAVLVIDGDEGLTKQDMRVSEYVLDSKKGLIVVINKADLLKPEQKNRISAYIAKKMAYAHFAPLIFTSAKSGRNILEILAQSNLIFAERQKKIKTRDLNYYIERMLGKHPPSSDVKFKFCEQVDINPPRFLFFVNDAEKVHFSYRRYLENKIREEYGFNGTAIDMIFKSKDKKPREKR
jgi:GTP-binding protein